jgi:hypothetical protein
LEVLVEVLSFTERMFVKTLFRDRMAELNGSAFEDFFIRVMTARYTDFVEVRTHGNIGDLSSDGLRLHEGKLYACYAPETFDAASTRGVKKKFTDDLTGALSKRVGEFQTFVFVYNDPRRGLQPEITKLLAQARRDHAPLAFEPLGPRQLLGELFRLVRYQIEEVFGAPIPVEDVVYGVGLEDLKPLLDHLVEGRRQTNGQQSPREVSALKMDYNRLDEDDREMLRRGMLHTHLVEEYYQGLTDVTERDEVAADFNAYYREIAAAYPATNEVIYELEKYVAGNRHLERASARALGVVLAYFFETCDILAEPPAGWTPPAREPALT